MWHVKSKLLSVNKGNDVGPHSSNYKNYDYNDMWDTGIWPNNKQDSVLDPPMRTPKEKWNEKQTTDHNHTWLWVHTSVKVFEFHPNLFEQLQQTNI